MIESELTLATLKYLLNKIKFYEKLKYEKFDSKKFKNKFDSLRGSIEFAISQTQESLKTNGITSPRESFSFKEIQDCLTDDTDIRNFFASLNKISVEIFEESERLGIEIINCFNILPEWIFPTSTATPATDIAFLESDYLSIDDFFIDTLMSNDRVQQTFNSWKTQSKISNRIPLIEEAIEAHIEGRFYLSVSALIPQIEGLLRDALKSMSRSADFASMRNEDMKRATSALKDSWKSQVYTLPEATSLLDSLPDAVSDLYDEFDPTQFVQGKLYRHGVCHGHQTDSTLR